MKGTDVASGLWTQALLLPVPQPSQGTGAHVAADSSEAYSLNLRALSARLCQPGFLRASLHCVPCTVQGLPKSQALTFSLATSGSRQCSASSGQCSAWAAADLGLHWVLLLSIHVCRVPFMCPVACGGSSYCMLAGPFTQYRQCRQMCLDTLFIHVSKSHL